MQGNYALGKKNINNNYLKSIYFSSIKSLNKEDYLNNLNKKNISELPANDNINTNGEISMWKSVIMQALVDIGSKSNKKMAKINRLKSGKWLNLRNKDFLIVCSYAELDPEYVIQKAENIKKSNPLYMY